MDDLKLHYKTGDILVHKRAEKTVRVTAVTTQLLLAVDAKGKEEKYRPWDLEKYEKQTNE